MLVTGDDFGKVKLFRYPAVDKSSNAASFIGHSSHVTQVRFSHDSKFIISTGGADLSIMQWKLQENGVDESTLLNDDDDGKLQTDVNNLKYERNSKKSIDAEGVEENVFEKSGGDEFMAVKPWLGAIVPPSAKKLEGIKISSSAPDTAFELKWIHGYSSLDCGNNVKFNVEGNIVYHAAACGIIRKIDSQQFHREHGDDIVCLSIHLGKKIIATGEMGKKPKIIVWDSTTGKTIKVGHSFCFFLVYSHSNIRF